MIKEFIRCMKLFRYTRGKTTNLVCCVVFLVIGIINCVVPDSDGSVSALNCYIGLAFIIPASQILQCNLYKLVNTSKTRKFLELYFGPITIAISSVLMYAVVMLIGIILTASGMVTWEHILSSLIVGVVFLDIVAPVGLAVYKQDIIFYVLFIFCVMVVTIAINRFAADICSLIVSQGIGVAALVYMGIVILSSLISVALNKLAYKKEFNGVWVKYAESFKM